jgi:O6-methylguanine-DNA--protein-cysteine methyltransferase
VTRLALSRQAASRRTAEVGDGPAARWRRRAEGELSAYLAGRRRGFTLRRDIRALPPFTRAVLRLVAHIPYGEVRTYSWVARQLGQPKAARAVGNALEIRCRSLFPVTGWCARTASSDRLRWVRSGKRNYWRWRNVSENQ